ncbi:MAG TPA: radical SAM protein [Anaerolineae bacterium]|nr:radical SAM protein [Anaerolineae bacterium]
MAYIYGPVPSWRLGRSLGVDPISTEGKTCSFDCIYCQLGRTRYPATERSLFVRAHELAAELESLEGVAMDYVTFSGMGEPTLAANLGELVETVRGHLPYPIAILTNSSLMARKEVRKDLMGFDLVVAKVDAPDEELFQRINRPFVKDRLEEIIEGIRRFREEFGGRLALQMMFVQANRDRAAEMAQIARELQPDEVQLNTPLRPSPVEPLSPAEMEGIEAQFAGLHVRNVYRAERPEVPPLDEEATRRRKPKARSK